MLPEKMMAVVCDEIGKFELREVDTPKIKEPTDVIGKVTLAAICTSDIHYIEGGISSAVFPKIMGHEFCIEVVEVGDEVTSVKVGDRCSCKAGAVCGTCQMCQLGLSSACLNGGIFGNIGVLDGCHAEYIRIPFANQKNQLIVIDDDISYEQVVMLPDMLGTAWFGLQKAGIKEGQTVAVTGVGPVGQSVCLLAKKYFNSKAVIAIDPIDERYQLSVDNGVADLGLNAADPELEKKVKGLVGPLGVDITIDTSGTPEGLGIGAAITRPMGQLTTVAIFDTLTTVLPITPLLAKGIEFKYGVQHCDGMDEMYAAIKDGRLDTSFFCTHKSPLNDVMEGYRVFAAKEDGCVKWLLTPYER